MPYSMLRRQIMRYPVKSNPLHLWTDKFETLRKLPVNSEHAVKIVFAKAPHDSKLSLIRSWKQKIAFFSIGLSIGQFHRFLFRCEATIKVSLKIGLNLFFGQVFTLEAIISSCMLVKKLTLLVIRWEKTRGPNFAPNVFMGLGTETAYKNGPRH